MFWRDDINPDRGPFKVLLKRGEFIDESRQGRVVPYKIYYPDMPNADKVPVIFWSHGFGGNRDGAAFISRFIAAHGYALVHLTHHGTDSSLWQGQEGHPWDVLSKISVTRETTLERFMDVPFVLESLEGKLPPEISKITEGFDFSNLGISGHSFGSLTTQVLAGQLFPNEKHILASYAEERFKAGIAYSPVPIRHLVGENLEEQIYGGISVPLFHMTGTEDESPLKGFDYKRRLVVHDYTAHPEKYLLVKKDGDHMVYNGTRGKLGANPKREVHEQIIKIGSLAFWDAYLKNDQNAKDWLTGAGFKTYIDDEADYNVTVP